MGINVRTLSESQVLGVDLLILVTLGTQKQQFTRLLDYIENSKINDEIIVQAGHTKYQSKKMKIIDFLSYGEMEELINKADIIITHGGTGSIITPLQKGKIVIACSRLSKYGEHVDNHQCELVNIFSEEGYIIKLDENSKLDDILQTIKDFKPKRYKSNTDKFVSNLKQEINDNFFEKLNNY